MAELNLILLGPPGAGKGTQAERLVDDFDLPYYATGNILRAAVGEGTELGRKAKEYMDRGDLVPDELVVGMIAERVEDPEAEDGFILDGFPRTMPQAEALDELLREIGRDLDVVFEFQIGDEQLLMKRMRKRAAEEGRSDDTPEAMRKRLDIFYAETAPLIEYYRSTRGNVVGIHADRTINEVFAEIQEALEQLTVRQ